MLEKAIEEMKLRGFTKKTQATYHYHIAKFINKKITKREYLLSLIENKKSPQSVRLASAAITFYEKHVLKHGSETTAIPRRQSRIPDILTKQQIQSMITATNNDKHKIIVELLYSSGLRLQELTDLKYEHVDFDNQTIVVRQGKGHKDRITIVAQRVLDRLDKKGTGYVLKGRKNNYSKKSVQLVIAQLAKKANIRTKVSPHTLRHSFSTHLLEQGTDIRYIQALLGHARLETTQNYTRVAKHNLKNIVNPLE